MGADADLFENFDKPTEQTGKPNEATDTQIHNGTRKIGSLAARGGEDPSAWFDALASGEDPHTAMKANNSVNAVLDGKGNNSWRGEFYGAGYEKYRKEHKVTISGKDFGNLVKTSANREEFLQKINNLSKVKTSNDSSASQGTNPDRLDDTRPGSSGETVAGESNGLDPNNHSYYEYGNSSGSQAINSVETAGTVQAVVGETAEVDSELQQIMKEDDEYFKQVKEEDTKKSEYDNGNKSFENIDINNFSIQELEEWIGDLDEQLQRQTISQEEYNTRVQSIYNSINNKVTTPEQRTAFENLRLSLEVKKALQEDKNLDFLKKYSLDQRLQYLTLERKNSSELKQGDELNISFRYEGKENADLYAGTSAGQILPSSVGVVKVGDIEYKRNFELGEYFSSSGKILRINEGMKIQVSQIRGQDELSKLVPILIPDSLKDNEIAKEAVKRGIDPQLAVDTIGKSLEGITDEFDKKAKIEQFFARYDFNKGLYGVSQDAVVTKDSMENNEDQKSLLGSLLNWLISPKQSSSDESAGGSTGGFGESESQQVAQDYGVSLDTLKTTATGSQLIKFLEKKGFPTYECKPSHCGRNVGEALLDFGIEGIPKSGRDGANYANFLANNPNFVKTNCTPEQAPPGAIISYQKNSGGSPARQAHGHVEIALGGGQGYYYGGKPKKNPGGSTRPIEGKYSVFVPVGTNNTEKPSSIPYQEGANTATKGSGESVKAVPENSAKSGDAQKTDVKPESGDNQKDLFGYEPENLGMTIDQAKAIKAKIESDPKVKDLDLDSDGSITKFVTRGKGIEDSPKGLQKFNNSSSNLALENPNKNSIREGLRTEAMQSLENLGKSYMDYVETLPPEQQKSFEKKLMVKSGYRDKDDPEWRDRKINQERAKSNESEHALGLAVDLFSVEQGEYSEERNWLKNNAHKDGYIVTYTKGVAVDGYKPEGWHMRYVGKELATFLHENNLSFAQFYKIKNMK